MQFAIFTNTGKIRNNNEDDYYITEKPYPLIAVADGMGGHRAGGIASKNAVEFIKNYSFSYRGDKLLEDIENAILQANQVIVEKGQKKNEYNGMGTTLSMGIIFDGCLFTGHVGDSRIYLYREYKLNQITTDHSLVNELLKKGEITPDDVFNHPQKNIITQALGTDFKLEVDYNKLSLQKEDYILFCTDGLTDMVRDEKIEDLFKKDSNVTEMCNLLGEMAMNNGGNDNITVVLVKIN